MNNLTFKIQQCSNRSPWVWQIILKLFEQSCHSDLTFRKAKTHIIITHRDIISSSTFTKITLFKSLQLTMQQKQFFVTSTTRLGMTKAQKDKKKTCEIRRWFGKWRELGESSVDDGGKFACKKLEKVDSYERAIWQTLYLDVSMRTRLFYFPECSLHQLLLYALLYVDKITRSRRPDHPASSSSSSLLSSSLQCSFMTNWPITRAGFSFRPRAAMWL